MAAAPGRSSVQPVVPVRPQRAAGPRPPSAIATGMTTYGRSAAEPGLYVPAATSSSTACRPLRSRAPRAASSPSACRRPSAGAPGRARSRLRAGRRAPGRRAARPAPRAACRPSRRGGAGAGSRPRSPHRPARGRRATPLPGRAGARPRTSAQSATRTSTYAGMPEGVGRRGIGRRGVVLVERVPRARKPLPSLRSRCRATPTRAVRAVASAARAAQVTPAATPSTPIGHQESGSNGNPVASVAPRSSTA